MATNLFEILQTGATPFPSQSFDAGAMMPATMGDFMTPSTMPMNSPVMTNEQMIGLLGVDRNRALQRGLLAAAAPLLRAGAGGSRPQDASLGLALGQAGMMGMDAYDKSRQRDMAQGLARMQLGDKLQERQFAQRFGVPTSLAPAVIKALVDKSSEDNLVTITPSNASTYGITEQVLNEATKNNKLLQINTNTKELKVKNFGESGLRLGDTQRAAQIKTEQGMILEGFKADLSSLKDEAKQINADNRLMPRLEGATISVREGTVKTGPIQQFTLPFRRILNDLKFTQDKNLPQEEVFRATQQYLIPRMREKGSGSTSDREMNAFAQATISLGNTPLANYLIGQGMLQQQKFLKKELRAKRAYLRRKKTIVGFENSKEAKSLGKFMYTATNDNAGVKKLYDLQKQGKIKRGDLFFKDGIISVFSGIKLEDGNYTIRPGFKGLQ